MSESEATATSAERRMAELEAKRSEILVQMDTLRVALASIKQDIYDAKAGVADDGVYADRDWFSRANYAAKMKGQLHQRLQRALADVSRDIRAVRLQISRQREPLEAYFVRAALRRLERDMFDRIMDEAKKDKDLAYD